MNKKSRYIFTIFGLLLTTLIAQGVYLSYNNSMSQDALDKKTTFLSITALPDLAISTESASLRHRTLSGVFSIYKDDGSLREYFPSSYAIAHSHIK